MIFRWKKRRGHEMMRLVHEAIDEVRVATLSEPEEIIVSTTAPRNGVTTVIQRGARIELHLHESDWANIELAAQDYPDTTPPLTWLWGVPVVHQ